GVLTCVAWAYQPGSTFRMLRWTLGPQGWVMSDLANDSGDATAAATYGRRVWNDFDCVARAADTVDCMELVGRSTRATTPGDFTDTSVHLRHASWRTSFAPTSSVSWSTFDVRVAVPFGISHLRCVSRGADQIDCFASQAAALSAGGPLMHAWFVPPRTLLNPNTPHSP